MGYNQARSVLNLDFRTDLVLGLFGFTDVVGYQDAIHHRGTTIDADGCALVRSEHSVDAIPQMSMRGRASHLTDNNPHPGH